MSKKMKVLLIVSLAFNLLIVGAAAGAFFMKLYGHGYWHEKMHDRLLKKVEPSKRSEISALLKKNRDLRRTHRAHFRQERKRLRTLLQAEPFDRAAFLAVAREIQSNKQQQHLQSFENIADIAALLSVEERKKLMRYFLRGSKRGRHRGSRRKKYWDEK